MQEIRTATLQAQRLRVEKSYTGRAILLEAGDPPDRRRQEHETDLSPEQRTHIKALPLPKNMHPLLHKERRQARVKFLHRKFGFHINTVYADVAEYDEETAALVVTNNDGDLLDCVTMQHDATMHAEASALLLAIRWGERNGRGLNVITDSHAAVRTVMAGRIHRALRRILPETLQKPHNITWTPVHEGLPGNEAANRRACDLAHHPPATDAPR